MIKVRHCSYIQNSQKSVATIFLIDIYNYQKQSLKT